MALHWGKQKKKNLNPSFPRSAVCDAASVATRAGRLQGTGGRTDGRRFSDVAGLLGYRTFWRRLETDGKADDHSRQRLWSKAKE